MRIRRRDIPLIKGLIMFAVGVPTGLAGAVSGIGMAEAAAPMLSFLLGHEPAKARANGLVFGLIVAACGVVGAGLAGLYANVGLALALAIGAAAGALLTVKQAANPRLIMVRRIAQTAAMLLAVYLMSVSIRSALGPQRLADEFFRTSLGYGVLGVAAGALSSLFALPGGLLVVAGLILLAGIPAGTAILTSLIVVAIASLLPVIGHVAGGRIDRASGFWMLLGGAGGALGGGLLLAKLAAIGSPIPMVVFGILALILCARTAWLIS